MKKADCAFCNYKEKKAVIYDDSLCYTVISKSPVNKYHVLVISKDHYEDFTELPKKLVAHVFLVAQEMSDAVRKVCKPDAIEHISDDDISNIGINLVRHYKIHIIPRFKDDKVKIDWNRVRDPGIKTRSKFAREVRNYLR